MATGDDCANVTKHQEYYSEPTAVIHQKSQLGRPWIKVSIFWRRFEICNWDSSEVSPFLSASVPLQTLAEDDIITTNKSEQQRGIRSLSSWSTICATLPKRGQSTNGPAFQHASIPKVSTPSCYRPLHHLIWLIYLAGEPLHIPVSGSPTEKLASFLLDRITKCSNTEADWTAVEVWLVKRPPPPKKKKNINLVKCDLQISKTDNYDLHLATCVQKLLTLQGTDPMNELSSKDALTIYKGEPLTHCRRRSDQAIKIKLYQLWNI